MGDPRALDLHLHLLDRQVIDTDGHLICKVDDLELEIDADGRPFVSAILVGPRALGARIGGRLGHWTVAIARRLADNKDEQPPRIDFAKVTDIGSAITIEDHGEDLNVTPLETWVDSHIISRLPGSTHESE
jgi:sporulation protein YlmC with PRC-barrel domain